MFKTKYLPTVLSICLLIALIIYFGSNDQDTEQLPVYTVNGPITVYYVTETPSGGTQGSRGIKASKLLMFEDYVVIKYKGGGGMLVPISKIINLNWE